MAIDREKLTKVIKDKYVLQNETFIQAVKDHPKDRITVEIGDSKSPDFKPQVKLMRWDNEVNFSIRAEEHPAGRVEVEGEKIKYITPEYEVHQYDRPEVGEDGGFEFEWILPKKPQSNVLTATIQKKGMDFFYQPALTAEEIAHGAERPENVVGSYAIYHSTKANNQVGGMEYKTGKVAHIYRPKAIDADGNETWCELNIGDVLTVTVPREFLDSAIYPVTVDPTLGYMDAGASAISCQDRPTGQVFYLGIPASVTGMTALVTATNAPRNVLTMIYDFSNVLVGQTIEVNPADNLKTWQNFTFSVNPSLASLSKYWLSVWAHSAGSTTISYDSTSGKSDYQKLTQTYTAPNPAAPDPRVSDSNATDRQHSMYVTYTSISLESTLNNYQFVDCVSAGIISVTEKIR